MAAVLVKPNTFGLGGMNSNLHRSASLASTTSPPQGPIGSKLLGTKSAMSPDHLFMSPNKVAPSQFQYPLSPQTSIDSRISRNGSASVLMRKLPRNTTPEALRSMLLFAKDLVDTEFVANDYEEDGNFLTAVAHFQSFNAAREAQVMLNGKTNSSGQATMIVEVMGNSSGTPLGRRNTVDHGAARGMSQSISSNGSMAPLARQSSRFNGTFQSMERVSPPGGGPNGHRERVTPDGASAIPDVFSPQSPIGSNLNDRPRVSGKSVIDEDTDEDTGNILKDPVAFMNNDHSSRRQANTQIPLNRFSGLSLSTNVSPPPSQSFTSPRSALNMASPPAMSPGGQPMGSTANYQLGNQQYPRHNYPPVNPADQNPPCNTLYVGNLPIDTSEDELKAMFSKQRGYKRLCFRTKQNGPMCFVEFEDVSFATKALNELYGVSLHNSVKGGIRLSFSKNPLGVRAGQPGGNVSAPMSPQAGMSTPNGLGSLAGQNFTSANGPPPGLSAPPGLGMPMGNMPYNHPMNSTMNPNAFGNNGLGIAGTGMSSLRGLSVGPNMGGTSQGAGTNSAYPDYMLGR